MVRYLDADTLEVVDRDGESVKYCRIVSKGRVVDLEWSLAEKVASVIQAENQ